MQQTLLHKNGGKSALLFFGGWGAEPNLFEGLRGANPKYFDHTGCDVILCWDYTTLDGFDTEMLEKYNTIYVQAWSMGIWAAEKILAQHPELHRKITKKIAINGTPTPIDDTNGIPVAVFNGTLENFSPTVLAGFRRRMCGSTSGVADFLALEPTRTLESLHGELQSLKNQIEKGGNTSNIRWDTAVIGANDLIFPAKNLQKYWQRQHCEIIETDTPHYHPSLF